MTDPSFLIAELVCVHAPLQYADVAIIMSCVSKQLSVVLAANAAYYITEQEKTQASWFSCMTHEHITDLMAWSRLKYGMCHHEVYVKFRESLVYHAKDTPFDLVDRAHRARTIAYKGHSSMIDLLKHDYDMPMFNTWIEALDRHGLMFSHYDFEVFLQYKYYFDQTHSDMLRYFHMPTISTMRIVRKASLTFSGGGREPCVRICACNSNSSKDYHGDTSAHAIYNSILGGNICILDILQCLCRGTMVMWNNQHHMNAVSALMLLGRKAVFRALNVLGFVMLDRTVVSIDTAIDLLWMIYASGVGVIHTHTLLQTYSLDAAFEPCKYLHVTTSTGKALTLLEDINYHPIQCWMMNHPRGQLVKWLLTEHPDVSRELQCDHARILFALMYGTIYKGWTPTFHDHLPTESRGILLHLALSRQRGEGPICRGEYYCIHTHDFIGEALTDFYDISYLNRDEATAKWIHDVTNHYHSSTTTEDDDNERCLHEPNGGIIGIPECDVNPMCQRWNMSRRGILLLHRMDLWK